jgi:hypothetical protein
MTACCWPVDPAGEEENEEGERRRQRVHGARVPERMARCKGAPDSTVCAIRLGRLPGTASLLRLRRIRRLSSDPASAEFSHRTGTGDLRPATDTIGAR